MSEPPMRRRSPFPFVKAETATPTPPADGGCAGTPEPSAPPEPPDRFADTTPTDPLDDAPWRHLPEPTPAAPR